MEGSAETPITAEITWRDARSPSTLPHCLC